MIKIDNSKKIAFELIFLSLVFFTLFVPNKYSKEVLALLLFICTIISFKLFKKIGTFSINNKKILIQITAFACIYVIGLYFIGVYSNFYKNPVVSDIKVELKYSITSAIIVILSELIRYTLITKKDKISATIVTASLVLIDINLYAQMYDITVLDDFLAVLGIVLFASVAENLLFNYISVRFCYKPVIIYRLITVLYMYLVPILPEIHTYFKAVIRIIYPYLIFLFLENVYESKKTITNRITKSKKIISSLSVIFIGVMLTLLVSCKFYVGIIAIGSNSMKGAIDKGDAVIFTKCEEQELKIGDVIVFKKNNINLIHRIVNIQNVNNELRFTTKGDNNNTEDQGYITDVDIIGISRLRLKYIGYPSILLGEFFDSIRK